MVIRLELEDNKKNILLREEMKGQGLISFYGGIYAINNVSLDILKLLNNKRNMKEVMMSILDDYEIECVQLIEDTIEFMEQLFSIGIISENLLNYYKGELYEFNKNYKRGF